MKRFYKRKALEIHVRKGLGGPLSQIKSLDTGKKQHSSVKEECKLHKGRTFNGTTLITEDCDTTWTASLITCFFYRNTS